MAANQLTVRGRFPRFTGMESEREQIRQLGEYCYELTQQLEFLLENLGMENWNKAELQKLQAEIARRLQTTEGAG